MQNDIIHVFDSEEFGKLRTLIGEDGEPWFVAKDVCDALGLGNVSQALTRLDGDEKSSIILNDGIPGNPNKATVSEAGLYSLVLASRKPEAKAFKRWVTHEVLPSIRKHGAYATPELISKAFQDPAAMAQVFTALADEQRKNKALAERNRFLEPKAGFYDRCMESDGLISVTKAAKVCKSYDKSIGMKKLFKALRQDKMLEKRTRHATAKAIERGYMKERPFVVPGKDGKPDKYDQYGCLTPKGLGWCVEHYCFSKQEKLELEEA